MKILIKSENKSYELSIGKYTSIISRDSSTSLNIINSLNSYFNEKRSDIDIINLETGDRLEKTNLKLIYFSNNEDYLEILKMTNKTSHLRKILLSIIKNDKEMQETMLTANSLLEDLIYSKKIEDFLNVNFSEKFQIDFKPLTEEDIVKVFEFNLLDNYISGVEKKKIIFNILSNSSNIEKEKTEYIYLFNQPEENLSYLEKINYIKFLKELSRDNYVMVYTNDSIFISLEKYHKINFIEKKIVIDDDLIISMIDDFPVYIENKQEEYVMKIKYYIIKYMQIIMSKPVLTNIINHNSYYQNTLYFDNLENLSIVALILDYLKLGFSIDIKEENTPFHHYLKNKSRQI